MLNQNSSLDLTNLDENELLLVGGDATENANEKFPTVGLKSLLQNSELLELLLKPLSSLKEEDSNYIRNNTVNTTNSSSNLFATDSDMKTKSLFDFENSFEYFECKFPNTNSISFLNKTKKIKLQLFLSNFIKNN